MSPSALRKPAPQPRPNVRHSAEIFRAAIDKALEDGVKPKNMLLRLTHGDASELKRDRTLAIEDISFAGGVMRFLGVKVELGGVTASRLDCGADAATTAA